jgi:hypothetical protein
MATVIIQEITMEHTITDSLGTLIQEGDKVIYNLSGELALGIIKRAVITKTRKTTYVPYSLDTYLIEIEYINSHNEYNKPKNGISRVKNPKSIIVLKGILHFNTPYGLK